MDEQVRYNIYRKFGVETNQGPPGKGNENDNSNHELQIWQHQTSQASNTRKADGEGETSENDNGSQGNDNSYYDETEDIIEEVNEDVLVSYLNQGLFAELHKLTLKELNEAFEQFKKTESYQILREDVNRQVKLYEVMYEAKLVSSLAQDY